MLTTKVTAELAAKKWVVVDATDQVVGRLSTEIARVLRGKHKAAFAPHMDNGDTVVVVNVDKMRFTGNKLASKNYYAHSGYIGGMKKTSAQELMDTYPNRVLEAAVKGMLPKNKLSRKLMKNLKVYSGSEHPHTAQNPQPMAPRTQK